MVCRFTLALTSLAVIATLGSCTGDRPSLGASIDAESSASYFPDSGSEDFDVGSYDVEATVSIDGADRLDGRATITAVAHRDLTSFELDLSGLTVDRVLVDDAEAIHSQTDSVLTVHPTDPVRSDATFVAVVDYHGEPAGGRDALDILEDGGGWMDLGDYSAVAAEPVGAPRWLPTNDRPSDKAEFSIRATVPSPLEAVSNGRLIERRDDGASSTFHWRADEPMAPYLMTLVIGEFELDERPTEDGPLVIDAIPPTLQDPDRGPLSNFEAMIGFFSDRFGPYPFSTAGQVIVPGMPPTALETQTRSVIAASALAAPDGEELVAHELAHQWFGDAVTPETWQDVWLNEGPAVFSQWLWAEHTGGPTVAESARDAHDPDDAALDVPPGDPGEDELFGDSVYLRSAMFLVELQDRIGERPFLDLMRTWVDDHRNDNATTEQFLDLAERIHGSSIRDLSGPWLFGDQLPELTI